MLDLLASIRGLLDYWQTKGLLDLLASMRGLPNYWQFDGSLDLLAFMMMIKRVAEVMSIIQYCYWNVKISVSELNLWMIV